MAKLKGQKGKRKVQGVPQSQTLRGRRNRQTQTSANRTNVRKSTKISFLFPKQGNRNAKRTEQYRNKITQGKT